MEKIQQADLVGVGVIGLPDIPGLPAEEMQEKFEETAREVIIPKFNALVDELSAPDAAGKVSAVSINAQELTEAQKATARKNIDALTWHEDVLDEEQKRQARANIGAIGAAEIGEMSGSVSYAAQQDLTEEQQETARDNIGAASEKTVNAAQTAADAAQATADAAQAKANAAQATADAAQAKANDAQATADAAQAKANDAMPKSGGNFTGTAMRNGYDPGSYWCFRDITVATAASENITDPIRAIIMLRK